MNAENSRSARRIPNTIVQLFSARTSVVMRAEIQSDLLYDYRYTTTELTWTHFRSGRRKCGRSGHDYWSSGGKYDLSFDLREPERYRQDTPNGEHVLDAGHFALDTATDEMAAWVGNFMAVSRSELRARRAG